MIAPAATAVSPAEERALKRMLPGAVLLPMVADGSGRRFFRDGAGKIAILPDLVNPLGMREARSCWKIGVHLYTCAVPVPRPLDFDSETGVVIFEDLGDVLLHDFLRAEGEDSSRVHLVYHRVVEDLARMQVVAAKGFDPDWTWQSRRYDREVMLALESQYFLREFVKGESGISRIDPAVETEFALIADKAAAVPAGFFLHRDFQSRNIMLVGEKHYFIDFQGGRMGPPGYDLASLLVDPYADLASGFRDDLFRHFFDTLAGLVEIDLSIFRQGYYCLTLQRNLQILGAFARLANRDHKEQFRVYMTTALESLAQHLEEVKEIFPALTALVLSIRRIFRGRTEGSDE